jgi:O-6-methylguanine DNA methyltransferase
LKGTGFALTNISFVKEKSNDERMNDLIRKAILQLNEYFGGDRLIFDIPLQYNGTTFQAKVWEALRDLDYGETVSYKTVAERIEHLKAYRAVGNANNRNQLPIIIPCHRVIGSKGKMTGYAGGIWRKEWLLEHEKKVLERKSL